MREGANKKSGEEGLEEITVEKFRSDEELGEFGDFMEINPANDPEIDDAFKDVGFDHYSFGMQAQLKLLIREIHTQLSAIGETPSIHKFVNMIRNVHTMLLAAGETISILGVVLTISAILKGFDERYIKDGELPLWIGSIGLVFCSALINCLDVLKIKNSKLISNILKALNGTSSTYIFQVIIGGTLLIYFDSYKKNGQYYVPDGEAMPVLVLPAILALLNGVSIFMKNHCEKSKNRLLKALHLLNAGIAYATLFNFYWDKFNPPIGPDASFDPDKKFMQIVISTPIAIGLGPLLEYLFSDFNNVIISDSSLFAMAWILLDLFMKESLEGALLNEESPIFLNIFFTVCIILSLFAPSAHLIKNKGNIFAEIEEEEEEAPKTLIDEEAVSYIAREKTEEATIEEVKDLKDKSHFFTAYEKFSLFYPEEMGSHEFLEAELPDVMPAQAGIQ